MFKWFYLWFYPSRPSCSLPVSFLSLFPPFSSVYLSFFLLSFCFLCHISFQPLCLCSFVYLFHSFSLFLFDVSFSHAHPFFLHLSFFLSDAVSSSPAVINRCLVGCWSVRNGRSNGCSQLLQAFPGSPHRTALCGPGFQTCRQNIQNMNTVLNIWTALMCARFISLNRPTSEHT